MSKGNPIIDKKETAFSLLSLSLMRLVIKWPWSSSSFVYGHTERERDGLVVTTIRPWGLATCIVYESRNRITHNLEP